MGFFSKRKREPEPTSPAPAPDPLTTLITALATALTTGFKDQLEGNAKIAGVFSEFTKSLGELTMRQAAQRLGARGGRASAERKKAKQKEQECVLCRDPFYRGVTIPMIEKHREHEPSQLEMTMNGDARANPDPES